MLDDADQELSGDMMLSTRPVILGNKTKATKAHFLSDFW